MFKLIKRIFGSPTAKEQTKTKDQSAAERENTFDLEAFRMSDDVKLYALSTCIHCRNTKKYLEECGVKYKCVHVDELTGDDRKKVVQEIKDHNPAVSFPTIVIKDRVVVGFHKDKIDAALNGD